jgi:hypothetical protein
MPAHRVRSVAAVPLALSLTLAACGGESDPAPPPGPPAGSATITIQGWPQGTTGTLRFYRNATVNNVLAEAPVTADGRATYALPVPAGLIDFTPAAGLAFDPPGARFQVVIAVTTELSGSGSQTGEVRLGSRLFPPAPGPGDTMGELFYADRDVTITGTAGGCTYDQRLVAGWNFVTNRTESLTPFACTISAAQAMPAVLGWRYVFLGP